MASGLPDFYRGVDITYQTLAQVTNRPKYGGAVGNTGTLSVTANSTNDLVSVTGKGMVYGSFINLAPALTQANSEIVLEIDATTIIGMSFNKLNAYHLIQPRCFPIVLLGFDNVNFEYEAGIAYGLTFETGIKLQYTENHGRTPSVGYTFIYALI